MPGLRRGGCIDLGDHRRHPRDEDPFLCGADARPAPFDRSARVGDVAAPEGEGRGGEVVGPGQLRLTDRGQLEHGQAEQARRLRARIGLDLDGGKHEDCLDVDDPDRQPAHRPEAHGTRFGPSSQEEERVGDVARQEVAVDSLQSRAPCVLDPLVCDLDRLGPAVDQVEDGGQVRPDAEERVLVVQIPSGTLRLAQEVDRDCGVTAPGQGDREGRRRVDLLGYRDRIAGLRDLDRITGEPLGLREDAVEHLELGERREDRRTLGAGFARDELHRSAPCMHRPGRVAAGPPDVRESLVQQAQANTVTTGIEPPDGGFEERRCA